MKLGVLFLILPLYVMSLSFNHCDYGVLGVHLQCGGEPYVGPYIIDLMDTDFVFDETMDSSTGYITNTSSPISLKAFLSFDDCRDVSMYLRIITGCPKELSLSNYGLTFGIEMMRRLLFPRLTFETCYVVSKDVSTWPVTVELKEHPYCGFTEM